MYPMPMKYPMVELYKDPSDLPELPKKVYRPENDANSYELEITFPPEKKYRYEPEITSLTVGNAYRYDPVLNFLLPENSVRDEFAIISSSPEYHFRYEPVGTSISPEGVYQYAPISFSALNVDEPTWKWRPTIGKKVYKIEPDNPSTIAKDLFTKSSSQKVGYEFDFPVSSKINDFYQDKGLALSKNKVYQDMPVKSSAMPKIIYRYDPLRTSTENYYQFEPFRSSPLAYRIPPSKTSVVKKKLDWFTPFLTSKSLEKKLKELLGELTATQNVERSQHLKTSALSKTFYQFTPFLTSETAGPIERQPINAASDNSQQMAPTKSSRSLDDYWKEFIDTESKSTHRETDNSSNTTPSRTSDKASSHTINNNESLKSSQITDNKKSIAAIEKVYQNAYLQTSKAMHKGYQHKPSRTSGAIEKVFQNYYFKTSRVMKKVYQHALLNISKVTKKIHQPLRTSGAKVYHHGNLKTSKVPEKVHQFSRSSGSIENSNQKKYLKISPVAGKVYKYKTLQKPSSSIEGVYHQLLLGSNATEKDNQQSRTSLEISDTIKQYHQDELPTTHLNVFTQTSPTALTTPDSIYRVKPLSRSTISDNLYYHVQPIRTTTSADVLFKPPRTTTGLQDSLQFDDSVFVTKDSSSHSTIYQGFKTLWKPTVTSDKNIYDPFTQQITSTTYIWNFNDEDAAWPKVELILSTTDRTTVVTKSKKTFATYFPFLRNTDDGPRDDEILVLTTPEKTRQTTKKANKPAPKKTGGKSKSPSRCYECGLNVTGIPDLPSCYHVFEDPGGYHGTSRNRYKVICKKSTKRQPGTPGTPQKSTKIYRDGCFKRYVDIGEIYNERGCRTVEPEKGKSRASSRLAKMEKLLKNVDEGCVTSPYASLTPFSNAISLFARYHACVCKGKYCNTAASVAVTSTLLIYLNILLSIWILVFLATPI